jgi:protein-tyrosine phosphatase
MNRIDVHCHFLPGLDDGCKDLSESLECLQIMAGHGYDRIFCTPHAGSSDFTELTCQQVAERVRELQGHVATAGLPIELRPGGELRLSPHIPQDMPKFGIPTFGHAGKYILVDLWEPDWPAWAAEAIEWLQKQDCTVIVAHPERMPVLRGNPEKIEEIAKLGVLFQGNLGPIGGADSAAIVALAHRFLQDGRYFMVGSDGHRANHMMARLQGLRKIEELVGKDKLEELTEKNPSRLWV